MDECVDSIDDHNDGYRLWATHNHVDCAQRQLVVRLFTSHRESYT
jgi:hypothetical protein